MRGRRRESEPGATIYFASFDFGVFHGQALSPSRRSLAPELLSCETGSGMESQGWCLPFGRPLRRFRRFVARMSEAISGDDGAASLPLPDCASLHPGYEEK